MPTRKSIASSLIWLLLVLPALFPAQFRPHVHVDDHAAEAGYGAHGDCSICDVPVLLDLPTSAAIPLLVSVSSLPYHAIALPTWESPHILFIGSRAPPAHS